MSKTWNEEHKYTAIQHIGWKSNHNEWRIFKNISLNNSYDL